MKKHVQGVDSALVLDYKGANQAVVAGLTKMSLPGITRAIVTIDELRTDFARKFAGGGEYGEITAGGNYVLGDTKGQDMLRQHCLNKTKLTGTDLMGWLNYYDFYTTDLANDPDSALQVVEAVAGDADKNGVYPFSVKLVPNGRLAVYSAHVTEADAIGLAFVDGAAGFDSITDSEARFVEAGFEAGMTLMIIGSTSNDAVHATITAVAAGTLTLSTKGLLNSEAGIEGCELHGGKI